MTIAILGATGNVGKPLVELLAKQGHAVRAATRSADKPLPDGVTRVSPENLNELMKGAESVFLLVPPAPGSTLEQDAVAAAKAAGVKRVVKLSSAGAAGETPRGLGVQHLARENHLKASGLAWTMLRPGFFMTNALGWVAQLKQGGVARNLYGDGLMFPIAPEDIAAIAAMALLDPKHEGQAYLLTGETGLTAAQEIEILGKVLGIPAKVEDVSPETGEVEARGRGASPEIAAALKDLYLSVRANKMGFSDPTARTLLGRPLMTFEEWARRLVNP